MAPIQLPEVTATATWNRPKAQQTALTIGGIKTPSLTREQIEGRSKSLERDQSTKHNATSEVSGWYYDMQLHQPLTSVVLKSNALATLKDKNTWEFKDIEDGKYEVEVARSIITSDFRVSTANSWEDNAMNDSIGKTLNTIKSFSPYAKTVQNVLSGMVDSQKIVADKAEKSGKAVVAEKMAQLTEYFGNPEKNGAKFIDNLRRASHGSFLAKGCSFTYYNGTGVGFGSLGMNFTIFPTWELASNGEPEWRDVMWYVARLLPYSIGSIQDIPAELKSTTKAVLNDAKDKLNEKLNDTVSDFLDNIKQRVSSVGLAATDVISTVLNEYIKWQAPPGGYNIETPKDIDEHQGGTLCLEIGPHYRVEGLVVDSLDLNFSKQLVKNPTYFDISDFNGFNYKSGTMNRKEEGLSPLYCDVTLGLRPVTKYSTLSLLKFIQGNVDVRGKLVSEMVDKLERMINSQSTERNKYV